MIERSDDSFAVRTVAGMALAGVLAGSGVAARKPAATIEESTTVVAVEVPVTVVRKGEAVRALERDDFEVLVDGEPAPVIGFEAIDLAVGRRRDHATATAEPSEGGVRHILLIFDLAFTPTHDSAKGLRSARTLLADGLHPSDRVAVGVYAEALGARLLTGFSGDRRRSELAVRALELVVGGGRGVGREVRTLVDAAGDLAGEGLRRFAADVAAYQRLLGGGVTDALSLAGEALTWYPGGGDGNIPDGVAETLADMERGHQREVRPQQVRARAFRFIETLSQLAGALRDVRGQRYLVLFSAGLEESLVASSSQSSGASQLHRVLETFARTGWEVHGVAVGAPQAIFGHSMSFLTEATGGDAYRNMQPDRALGRLMAQTSAAYVLTIQPVALGGPGDFHAIEVRLRDGVTVAGALVRHRAGFHGPSTDALDPASIGALTVGSEVATYADGGDFGTRLLALAFDASDEESTEARVPLVLEIAGRGLRGDAAGPLQLVAAAYRLVPPSGVLPLFVQPMVLDPERHPKAFAEGGGVKLYAEARLPAGAHRLRVVVSDPIGGRRAVATTSVFVPTFAPDLPHVLPPIVPDTDDRWMYVQHQGSRVGTRPFPFRFADRRFMPQAAVTVAAGRRIPVVMVASGLPDAGVGLSLVLETDSGSPLPGERLRATGVPELGDGGQVRMMAEVDSAGLAPGRYRLRLVWSDAATGVVREAWRTFTVVDPGKPKSRAAGAR